MQKIEKLREMCTELVNQITDKDDTQRDTSGKRCESDQVESNRWWIRQLEGESSKFNWKAGTQEIQTFTRADKQKFQTVQEPYGKETLFKQGVGMKATEDTQLYHRASDALLINDDKVIRALG